MAQPRDSHATLVGLLLAAATVAVFAGVFRNGFVSFDDEIYVLGNAHVRTGLSLPNIGWALTATEAANWHPLTWLSHMTDVSLFGLSPAGHHATSLLLHVANVLLVFGLLRRATGKTERSAAVAAFFALHPLRVESVAWVAERKDVLSMFLGLLAIAAYGRWARSGARLASGRYAASVALFAASLMAKATLVTLPLLLLVLDFWPLGRFAPAGERVPGARPPLSRLLLEKVPYAVLAAGSAALTYYAQTLGGATQALSIPLGIRLENAVVSVVLYLGKTLWPSRLAVLYPHSATTFGWLAAGAVLLLLAISGAVLMQERRRPYLIAGWAWYLIALLPVLGIVQVGWQAFADRYTYVPSLGIAAALVWGVAEAAAGRIPAKALAAAAIAVLAALSLVTIRQVATWHDSLTLYEHAVSVTGPNETMEIDLGNELARRGRTEEAGLHFEQALRIAPGSKDALYALASLALREGRLDQAASYSAEAARRNPDFAEAHVQQASILVRQGRPAQALEETARALAIHPGLPEALYVEGVVLDGQGRASEAEARYRAALAAKPDYAEAHENLGELLESQGRPGEAAAEFAAALAARPDFDEARQSLEAIRKKAAAAGGTAAAPFSR